MSDPVRLRDLPGDDGAFAKALLRSAEPTRALSAADALRLQATVAKVAAAPASAGLLAGATPYVLAALATVGAVTGAVVARPAPRRAPPAVTAQAPRAVTTPRPPPEPAAAAVPTLPAPTLPAPTVPAPTVPAPTPSRSHRARVAPVRPVVTAPVVEIEPIAAQEPTLSDELRVIREARATLRTDPAGALRVLAEADRAMPRGQLRDEREAVAIEALVRAGRVGEARARVEAFERRSPNSPQGARLRALLRDAP